MFRSVVYVGVRCVLALIVLIGVLMGWGQSITSDVLAFASDGPQDQSRLYLMDIDRQVIFTLYKDTDIDSPSWSPDGRYIAFTTEGGYGAGCLCVIEVETSTLMVLMNDVYLQDGIFWSPDSQQIAFALRESSERDIYIANIQTGEHYNLTDSPNRQEYWPRWSPDSAHIVFMAYRMFGPDTRPDIQIVDLQSRRVSRLINSQGADEWPEWSPDGTQLAFESDRNGNSEIYLVDLNSRVTQNLTNSLGADYTPVWSPDGAQLAFGSYGDGSRRMGVELHVMDANGENLQRLTLFKTTVRNPHWSPDGERIAFEAVVDGHWDIYVVNTDGTNLTQLSFSRPFDWIAGWRP